ncbi:MAG: nuclear transport factor 2 family protein [Oscillospiraceae bacterium]|nr:nuclear transport factor 2 family protein [Oscillospiraceae bacterium]
MSNKEVIREFYNEVFNKWDTSKLEQYMREDYRQHNPTVENGREGFRKFCQRFFAMHPKMEIVRLVEEGDIVVVFFRCINDGGVNKVCDIYRFDENHMLAEHCDVVQHIPEDLVPVNDNGQF